jgi:hypothetical protein
MLLALRCWANHPYACCIYPRKVQIGHQRYHAAPAPPLSTSVVDMEAPQAAGSGPVQTSSGAQPPMQCGG